MKRILGSSVCVFALLGGFSTAEEGAPAYGDIEAAPQVYEDDLGFFSHGYYRLGFGSTDGEEFTAFQLDGANSKFRLGNESDLYTEFLVGYRAGLGNGSNLVAGVMANAGGDSNALNFGSPLDSFSGFNQAYVGIERVGDGALAESFVWAGRRFYRRRDVHMTDFYYENFSNDGIGVEDVDFGSVMMSTAVFYYDKDDDGRDYKAGTFDLRFHDIALGGGWRGEVGLAYMDASGSDHAGDDGYSVRLHAENDELSWGRWYNSLMYGRGAALEFDSTGNDAADSSDSRWRFVTQALLQSSDDLETQATAVWQRTEIDDETETWFSAGVRPQYNLTQDFGLAVELGYDRVSPENGDTGSLRKLTLAPFYSFGQKGYFARPQLRAFVTWADWNEAGVITAQDAFGNDTSGTTYGLQLEHWW